MVQKITATWKDDVVGGGPWSQDLVKKMMINTDKKILDCTCGSRGIWFNKHHPDAVYMRACAYWRS